MPAATFQRPPLFPHSFPESHLSVKTAMSKIALSNKRKYPMAEFKSFVAAAKCYIEALGKDPLIHRDVVSVIDGLREFLEIERRRVPGEVLYEADRLECLFFARYDPHFERDEPPGL